MNKLTISKYLILSVIGLTASTMAHAGDMGDASNSWTGVYLGFNLGGIFEHAYLNAQQIGFQNLEGICNESFDFSSAYPGIQLGWTKQLENKWVIGFAGNYNYIPNNKHKVNCVCALNSNIADRFDLNNNIQASILGRLGYSSESHLLPYVSTGLAISQLRLNYNNESALNPYVKSSLQTGWQVGGGLEWGFASNWSLSAEYYYTDYSAFNMGLPVVYGLADPDGHARVKMNANNVQASIKYWFY